MIKLLEPFSTKIQLHIEQDFLQKLWDKYVPVSSELYEHISLIYLKGMAEQKGEGWQQVDVLVDLTLKNMHTWMSVKQSEILASQNVVERSLEYIMKNYLGQLKRQDFRVFESLNQYFSYLENTQEDNRRYESWKKETRIIESMQKEQIVLREFASKLKNIQEVRSAQIEKMLEKQLFQSLTEKEYRVLTKEFIWQEKKPMETYLKQCGEVQYRQIVERLKKNTHLYRIMVNKKRRAVESIEREQLMEAIKTFEQREFQRFYQTVVFPEEQENGDEVKLLRAGIVWKKEKSEMINQINRLAENESHQFWRQINPLLVEVEKHYETVLRKRNLWILEKNRVKSNYNVISEFSSQFAKVQKRYVEEIQEVINKEFVVALERDEYEIISRVVDIQTLLVKSKDEKEMFENISLVYKELQQKSQEQEEVLLKQKEKILEEYKEKFNGGESLTQTISRTISRGNEWVKSLLLWKKRDQQLAQESDQKIPTMVEAEVVWQHIETVKSKMENQRLFAQARQDIQQKLQEQKNIFLERKVRSLEKYRDVVNIEKISKRRIRERLREQKNILVLLQKNEKFFEKYRDIPEVGEKFEREILGKLQERKNELSSLEQGIQSIQKPRNILYIVKKTRLDSFERLQERKVKFLEEHEGVFRVKQMSEQEVFEKLRGQNNVSLALRENAKHLQMHRKVFDIVKKTRRDVLQRLQEQIVTLPEEKIRVLRKQKNLFNIEKLLGAPVRESVRNLVKDNNMEFSYERYDLQSNQGSQEFSEMVLRSEILHRWREAIENNVNSQRVFTKNRRAIPKRPQSVELYPELMQYLWRYEKKSRIGLESGASQFQVEHPIDEFIWEDNVVTRKEAQIQRIVRHQNLNFAVQDSALSIKQQNTETQFQKDALYMKDVQQQLDKRLKEVEEHLLQEGKQVEVNEQDIREIADKVKRQLHDELHMERMRRGMS